MTDVNKMMEHERMMMGADIEYVNAQETNVTTDEGVHLAVATLVYRVPSRYEDAHPYYRYAVFTNEDRPCGGGIIDAGTEVRS